MLNKVDTVQLDLLRTFVVVARSRTFTDAAAQRHVTVSAISQQIRTLESQLGIILFERAGRRAQITGEGQILFKSLEAELDRIDEIVGMVTSGSSRVRGRIGIGAPRTFGAFWLRPRLRRLLSEYPELEIEVDFASPSELERRLVEGKLDLVLLARPVESPGVIYETIYVINLVAIASPDYLDKCGNLKSHKDFLRQSYLAFDSERSMLIDWWRTAFGPKALLPEKFVCQVRSIEELLALAETGLGITVLPEYSVLSSVKAGQVRVLDLEMPPAQRDIFLAWRQSTVETSRIQAVRAVLSDKTHG